MEIGSKLHFILHSLIRLNCKSEVWSYFKKLNNGSAECHVDKCGKVLKPGGTTTSLASHLNSQHKIFEKKRKPEGSLFIKTYNYSSRGIISLASLKVESDEKYNQRKYITRIKLLRAFNGVPSSSYLQ